MMLVMTTTGIFDSCHSNLIDNTWRKLNEFVPQLQSELNPALPCSRSPDPTDQPSANREDEVAACEQKATNNGEFCSHIQCTC